MNWRGLPPAGLVLAVASTMPPPRRRRFTIASPIPFVPPETRIRLPVNSVRSCWSLDVFMALILKVFLSTLDLRNDPVRHAAGPESAREFSGEDLLRKSQLDSTRLIERFQLIGCERKLEARKVVLELRELACADDWNY